MLSTFPAHLDADESQIDPADVTVRPANPADQEALRRLAALEGRGEGETPHLVAEHDGDVIASLSLADGTALADPFRRTAAAADLLRAHAERRGAVQAARRGVRPLLRGTLGGAAALLGR